MSGREGRTKSVKIYNRQKEVVTHAILYLKKSAVPGREKDQGKIAGITEDYSIRVDLRRSLLEKPHLRLRGRKGGALRRKKRKQKQRASSTRGSNLGSKWFAATRGGSEKNSGEGGSQWPIILIKSLPKSRRNGGCNANALSPEDEPSRSRGGRGRGGPLGGNVVCVEYF